MFRKDYEFNTIKKVFMVSPFCMDNLVRAECMRTNIVPALADVVATKLGIILLLPSYFFLYFFLGRAGSTGLQLWLCVVWCCSVSVRICKCKLRHGHLRMWAFFINS